MEKFSVVTQSQVNVRVTSSANSFGTEKRFPKDLTIADFKVCCHILTVTGMHSLEHRN